MATGSRHSTSVEDALLKQRVKELEEQVSSYKKKLDDLRKAKNITIMKREREVLEVNTPNLGVRRDSDLRVADLQRQLDQTDRQKREELDALRKKLQAEIDTLKTQQPAKVQAPGRSDNDDDRLSQLLKQLEEVRGDNSALVIENRGLQDQVHQLVMELSEKEALWCEREEQLNQRLNEQWGEKYAEWIAKVDHKMEELQKANEMLKSMLKNRRPSGHDPSGQDSSSSN